MEAEPRSHMPTTRLFVECPNCHAQYLIKGLRTYSNGAIIENVAGTPATAYLSLPTRRTVQVQIERKIRLHVVQTMTVNVLICHSKSLSCVPDEGQLPKPHPFFTPCCVV